MKLKITRIIEVWDMRERHRLRRKPSAQHLKPGEVILAFNGKQTIARFIDAAGGVHDYYAAKHERFDVEVVRQYVQQGLRVDLQVGTSERDKADALQLVA